MTQLVELTSEYMKGHMARAIPGAYFSDESKAWMLADPTPRAAAVTLRLFPELSMTDPWLEDLRDQLLQDVRPFDNATPFDTRVEARQVREQLLAENKDLFDFQAVDLGYMAAVLQKHGGAYIGWERGLGKTLAACALIDELDCTSTLVVSPNTAKESVWADELARWCPWLEIFVLPNDLKKRERMMSIVLAKRRAGVPLVLIAHYEALAIIAGKKPGRTKRSGAQIGTGWDKYGAWDLIVSDETHRIANPKAQMTRALKKVPATWKVALSGSIIQNHAEELFSPLQWLFPKTYRAKWRDWNDRFLDYIDAPYKTCIGVKLDRIEEMRAELGVFMVYRRKEDELDLPAKIEQTLLVDLLPAQRRAYDDLLTTCVAELDDGTRIKAADGLVMLTRLRQLATGLDLLGDTVTDSSKLDLAIELIEDNEDEAFVVFNWYKASGRSLQERLEAKGIPTFLVDGDVPPAARAAMISAFQAGEGSVFIGTLSTLGESVTLHRASNAIFIDRSWNPSLNVQAADRIYRIGQDKKVTVTHIIAKNTVDELRVQPTIANKEALRRLILGGL